MDAFADADPVKREEERLMRHVDASRRRVSGTNLVSKSPPSASVPASATPPAVPTSPCKPPQMASEPCAESKVRQLDKEIDSLLAGFEKSPRVGPAQVPTVSPPSVQMSSPQQTTQLQTPASTQQQKHQQITGEDEGAYCWYCDREITGRHYNCQDRLFHVECLLCRHCARPLERYCLSDDDDLYCPDCYRALFVHLPSCHQCTREIAGVAVTALGTTYHPECFRCAQCSAVITDEYIEYDGRPYCSLDVAPCYKLARGSICYACSKPLQENYLKVLGRMYHKGGCFRCAGCATPFPTLEFYPINDKPYCESCALRISEAMQQ
eukprot:m51a1_g4248 putative lim-type zinc finger-containing protein (323) ;mRNA; f:200675-202294